MDQELEREQTETREDEGDQMPSWREVFLYFLMLGFANIGGPVAQITMMYNHMVERRHWLLEDRFAVHVTGVRLAVECRYHYCRRYAR